MFTYANLLQTTKMIKADLKPSKTIQINNDESAQMLGRTQRKR